MSGRRAARSGGSNRGQDTHDGARFFKGFFTAPGSVTDAVCILGSRRQAPRLRPTRAPSVRATPEHVPPSSADYHDAALERMSDADQLKRLSRYPIAMYTAGVAVECMLRAFRHTDREHAAHHDVTAHVAACDRGRLGERAWSRLRGPVQTVHMLWLNNLRYTHELRLRRHLNDLKYFERVKRGSDTLKVACIELIDAGLAIVSVGDERWRNP
jgi:hypothetical protein